MITFGIRVKENKVKGDLGKFREYLGKLTGDLLKQEGCLTARAALIYSPPIVADGGNGDTAEAGKYGEKAIAMDVNAIFAPYGSTLQSVFRGGRQGDMEDFLSWREKPLRASSSLLLKKIHEDSNVERAFKRAGQIYIGKEDRVRKVSNIGQMSTIHKSQRKNGRVVREGRPSKEIKRYPYITKQSMINRYVKLRSRAVGKLKSGWYSIINTYGRNLNIFGRQVDAGAKSLPKYITRFKGPGTLVLRKAGGNSQKLTVTNSIGDADGTGMRAGTEKEVMNHRRKAIEKRPYEQYAGRIVRNWNRMQRPNA